MPGVLLRLITLLVPAALLFAGCGGSSSHTTTTTGAPKQPVCPPGKAFCLSTSPAASVSGSPDLATNLTNRMRISNPALKTVHLTCAPSQTRYPKICQLTGTAISKGKTVRVKGDVAAFGVDTKTHTYAYQVNYAPVP